MIVSEAEVHVTLHTDPTHVHAVDISGEVGDDAVSLRLGSPGSQVTVIQPLAAMRDWVDRINGELDRITYERSTDSMGRTASQRFQAEINKFTRRSEK